MINIRSLMCE